MLSASRDLTAEAFAVLAARLGRSENDVLGAWSVRSTRERLMWLDACETDGAVPGGALEVLAATTVEAEGARSEASRLRSLMSWLPQPPVLGLATNEPDADVLRHALALVTDAPRLPVLLCIHESALARVRAHLSERGRVLLAQGIIALSSDAPSDVIEGTPSAPKAKATETSASVGEDKLARAIAAAREAATRGDDAAHEHASRARSLAEQRLFELLQADPATRALFVLNGRLPFTFGPNRAEIDLVCAELRVAVEVDGYHHFQDSDAYRRDRRKDVLLQHQGYLVSRHLADDVHERPGEVVRAIRELVQRRQRSRRRGKDQ